MTVTRPALRDDKGITAKVSGQANKLVLYFAAEDWFFVSHFLSIAVAAQRGGFTAAVVTRVRDPRHAASIQAAGVRLIETHHERGTFGPFSVAKHILEFAGIMRREKPAVIHLISLRLILLGSVAALLSGCRRRVHAITGLGFLGASPTMRAKAARALFGFLLRMPFGGAQVQNVFENDDDPGLLGMDARGANVMIVGGAGVDAAAFTPEPLGACPPLRAALVARMVESKGIAFAVDAVKLARAAGHDVTLSLFGMPDPDNPSSLDESVLRAFARDPGISWHGQSDDVRKVWRDHHIACVPSLGGEGLPRSLLEAAACGRAIITTNTPGCRTFVRDGVEGRVVAPGDAPAIAGAFAEFAGDTALLSRCGAAARARLLDGFTSEAVAAKFVALYQTMMEDRTSA